MEIKLPNMNAHKSHGKQRTFIWIAYAWSKKEWWTVYVYIEEHMNLTWMGTMLNGRKHGCIRTRSYYVWDMRLSYIRTKSHPHALGWTDEWHPPPLFKNKGSSMSMCKQWIINLWYSYTIAETAAGIYIDNDQEA